MSVWVLCPNGHRIQINIAPNTPLNAVRQQACEKQGFSPGMYGLRRESQKGYLDLSLPFRLSGIPNKAKLELFEEVQRESVVKVALQSDTGERVMVEVGSCSTLLDTIHRAGILAVESVTYLQQRITRDKLESVTLADLGIFKGSAMLRLQGVKQPTSAAPPAAPALSPAIPPGVTSVGEPERKCEVPATCSAMEVEEEEEEEEEKEEEESKPILFNPSSNTSMNEEPEGFYDLDDRDLKVMLRDLHKLSERQLRLKQAPQEGVLPDSVIFRIRFPTGAVLQSVYKTTDTTTSLYAQVSSYLTPSSAPNLALQEGRRVIPRGVGLREAGLGRTTLLHTGGGVVVREGLALEDADSPSIARQIDGVLGAPNTTNTSSITVTQPSNGGGTKRPARPGGNKPRWFKL